MKKNYERPESEVICYSTPDITSVSGQTINKQDFTNHSPGENGIVSFDTLHG